MRVAVVFAMRLPARKVRPVKMVHAVTTIVTMQGRTIIVPCMKRCRSVTPAVIATVVTMSVKKSAVARDRVMCAPLSLLLHRCDAAAVVVVVALMLEKYLARKIAEVCVWQIHV